jgi:hypothetical protein
MKLNSSDIRQPGESLRKREWETKRTWLGENQQGNAKLT